MIIHVDMDAFYASIEERDDPSLVGKPVIVGGSAEARGVVAAANYEVRKYGVHSAMSSKRAKQLCPHAVFVKTRMDHYAAVSKQIREIFERFTPLVEPLSLDEAFLDVAGSVKLFGSPATIAKRIKQRIRDELRLVASVGVAPTKFVAKIASDIEKPDGFVVVEPDHLQSFLDPLPVGRIWGVGKVTGKIFDRLGIRTIGQLRGLPVKSLTDAFGSAGEHYWKLAQGIDERRVVPDREAKSISHETTFPEDVHDPDVLRAVVVQLAEQVSRRLRHHKRRSRVVELKVRFSDFETITRSKTFEEPTDITKELLDAGLELLTTKLPARHLPIRLLGFGVHHLDSSGLIQQQLFDEDDRNRLRELDRVADQIAAKFGGKALRRGTGLDSTPKE